MRGASGYTAGMLIRDATLQDAAAVAQGEYAAAATPGLLNARPGEIPESAFADKILALSEDPGGLYVVAEQDGELAGHLLLDPLPLAANAHVCSLNIVVYPEWQGRGLGRKLMEHAVDWARRTPGVEKIELRVRASNARAIALYRSLGFEEEGRIRKRVKIGQAYHDDLAMSLFT